jgi:hypothetical protein
MTSPHAHSLIARLRASSRLMAWVLLVFVMKIGMVAACTVHDFQDVSQAGKSALTAQITDADTDAESGTLPDPKTPDPFQHANGCCVDCGCHHAGLLPEPLSFAFAAYDAAPITPSESFRWATVRREMRPPIV